MVNIIDRLVLRLPPPDRNLSPNRKNGKHWAATKGIKEVVMAAARVVALEALSGKVFDYLPAKNNRCGVPVLIVFRWRTPAKRLDSDNALSAMKHPLDAVCRVIGIDDKHLYPVMITHVHDCEEESAEVIIGATDEDFTRRWENE